MSHSSKIKGCLGEGYHQTDKGQTL